MNFGISRKIIFYINFSTLLMLILFLIIDLISVINFPIGIATKLDYGERVSYYYSFFTTQSNYLVTIYFAYCLYSSHFKKMLPGFEIRLAVTVYISITMLVFWIGIFTQMQDINQYKFYNWINTTILHLIMPVIMIINFILTSGNEKIAIKTWHHNYLWLIALYPAVYSIIILIRGHLRFLDNKPINTWYPYFFFNVNQPCGWLIATVAIITIFGLVFGLQYFYIKINNLMFDLTSSKKQYLKKYNLELLNSSNKKARKK